MVDALAPGTSDQEALDYNAKLAETGPLAHTGERVEKFEREQKGLQSNLGRATAETRGNVVSMDEALARLRPPTLELEPPPKPTSTDPAQIWGSMAMVIAGLGSLASRRHLTTAMNAAAAVFEGYRKNDQAAAQQAFATWKASNENALKIGQYQLDIYKAILSSVSQRERTEVGLGGIQEREAAAAVGANARAFGDVTTAQIAEQHGVEAVQRHIDRMDEAHRKLKDSSFDNEVKQEKYKALQDWKRDHPGASQVDTLKEIGDIEERTSKSRGGGQAAKEKARKQAENDEVRLTTVNEGIDRAIKLTQGGWVAGIPGMVGKLGESAAGAVGVQTRSAPAHLYESERAAIFLAAGKLLAEPGQRSNKEFRIELAKILPHIAPGNSILTQTNALMTLSNLINQLNGKPIKYPVDAKGQPLNVPQIPRGRGPDEEETPEPTKTGMSADERFSALPKWTRDPNKPIPRTPAEATQDNPIEVRNQGEYNSMPAGTWIVDANGRVGQKPGGKAKDRLPSQ